eukprot:TRINITY_DN42416_c0_g1_i1.p1 TRINITY_DN42416_c0_g1~~TRINITY_DN42416_c0_g1_i1.p1  ORF type:complete len:292 (+),score=46.49 TRINITY_DN42416_c0_g1_i1:58-933(+)
MPSSSSGKRSMKAIAAQSYVGKSASQQVKAAQWTGQFAWNSADHPNIKKSGGCHGHEWPETNIDYDKPWFEKKDGDYFCNLCHVWATEGHVQSDRHKTREASPEWYGFGNSANQVVSELNEPWFENKAGEMYCNLCGSYATDAHVQSDKHKKRAANPEWYGYARTTVAQDAIQVQPPWLESRPCACTEALPIPAQYNHAWFEKKQGDWYCNLCGCWATDGHITSAKHEKRAQWPSYYGFAVSASVQPLEASQQLSLPVANGYSHDPMLAHNRCEAAPQLYGLDEEEEEEEV